MMASLQQLIANPPPLLLLALAPVIYVAMVALGRILRRRQQVPLGFAYRCWCVIVALWLPVFIYVRTSPVLPQAWWNALRQLNVATVIFGTFFVIALMRRYVWQVWFESKYHVRAPKFLADLSSLALLAGAVIFAISLEKGQPITGITVGSTLVAAILGLALQDLLGNIIAGIALEIGKPFKPGDWLVIDNRQMEVVEVNWRSTRLRTNDDIYFDIPNRTVAGSTITNLSLNTKQHALRIQVGFDYSLPPNVVKDRLKAAAAQARGVLASPPPKVFLNRFGEHAVIYEIKFWLEDEAQRNDIMDAVQTNVWYEAQRSQMRIPLPTQVIQVERPKPAREAALESARGILRRQPFLQQLNEEQTDQLLRSARVLRFGRNERVIEQGAKGQSMFILLSGEANVFVRSGGIETKVGTIRAGEYCGEMSLLTGEPRSATVVAQTDCEMWEIEKGMLAEVLQENRELVANLGGLLAQRRMENEGILASNGNKAQVETKKQEYTEGFLRRLSSFFEL